MGKSKYTESELLMLSGLQHYIFCPRQWALIHIEQFWSENLLTARGRLMHEKVHSAKTELRGNVRICRTLKLVSFTLGLTGQADVVEFHKITDIESGIKLEGVSGFWQPFPVEYKLGKPKTDQSDEIQLCAQAICLEEMLHTQITGGAVFYGKQKRRKNISFTQDLRTLTNDTALKIHSLFRSGKTPLPQYTKKCDSCSLYNQCLPKSTVSAKSAGRFIKKMIDDSL